MGRAITLEKAESLSATSHRLCAWMRQAALSTMAGLLGLVHDVRIEARSQCVGGAFDIPVTSVEKLEIVEDSRIGRFPRGGLEQVLARRGQIAA
jgi:hypothetical protein